MWGALRLNWVGGEYSPKVLQKSSQNEASGLHFGSQNGAKMALGGLRGPLGRRVGSRSLPGRLPKRSRSSPGPKKIHCGEIFQRDFTLPGGGQDAIKIDPGALLEASGGETNSLVLAGPPPRKILEAFFIVLRPPRSDFGLHFASPGGVLGGLFGVCFKKRGKPGFCMLSM